MTHDRLVAKLTDPARNTGAGRGRSYPLTGDRKEELSVCGNVVDERLC